MTTMQAAGSRTSEIEAAAAVLAAAVRSRSSVAALPGDAPRTIEEAYAVQEALATALGPVGGWKVSPLVPGGEPRCSPIPASFLTASPATLASPLVARGQAELEIGIRLARDLASGGKTLSTEEVAAAVAGVHPVIEILGSRFDRAAPELHRFADLANCGGLVVGPAVTAWRDIEFSDLALTLSIEGQIHTPAAPQPPTERTFAAIAWLALHAEARGRLLKAGQIIITGARVGPVPFGPSGEAMGAAGALGDVRITPQSMST